MRQNEKTAKRESCHIQTIVGKFKRNRGKTSMLEIYNSGSRNCKVMGDPETTLGGRNKIKVKEEVIKFQKTKITLVGCCKWEI